MAYALPTATDLKQRYPAFAAVDDATVDWWLDYVIGKDVDQSWGENMGPEGNMAAAAHRMVKAGIGIAGGGASLPAGVTDFKSGSVSIAFSAEAAKKSASSGWDSTTYGDDYAAALFKEKGGPRVIGGGVVPCGAGFNGFAGPLPPWVY
jgi:hypothetical protein